MIAVDLDGVLCHGAGRYESRTPDREQIERVAALHALGWSVVVWTARERGFESQRRTETWLRKNGVPFERCVLGKPSFDALVDDRSTSELPDDVAAFARRALTRGRFRSSATPPPPGHDDVDTGTAS